MGEYQSAFVAGTMCICRKILVKPYDYLTAKCGHGDRHIAFAERDSGELASAIVRRVLSDNEEMTTRIP